MLLVLEDFAEAHEYGSFIEEKRVLWIQSQTQLGMKQVPSFSCDWNGLEILGSLHDRESYCLAYQHEDILFGVKPYAP